MTLMPLAEVLALRRRLPTGGNPLFPRLPATPADRAMLDGDAAFARLPDHAFTPYSMEPATLAVLKAMVSAVRPRLVVEFGSGISTVVLAAHLAALAGDGEPPHLVSIDQSETFAAATRDLLDRAGVAGLVTLLVAEPAEMTVHGRHTRCYGLDAARLAETLAGRSVNLVVIDGPVAGGPDGDAAARFATVPLLRSVAAPGAPFVLDDALRDGELEIARVWAALPYVEIHGLKAVGKGLLVGRFRSQPENARGFNQ